MKFINRTVLSNEEKLQILALWNKEYPEKLSYNSVTEFENYLNNLAQQSHILLVDQNHIIKGWYVDFIRDNEKWFAIILDNSLHGKGWGSKLLALAKQKENELNGWFIDHNNDQKKNGTFYQSPLNFYLKNDFKIVSEKRLELEKISAVKINWKKSY